MGFVAALNDIPRPIIIAAMVLGFVWYWPVGLAVLAYLLATRRMGLRCGPGRWYNMAPDGTAQGAPGAGNGQGWAAWTGCGRRQAPPSGNAAFDEYRAETLRRLEEEQREFLAYLERLRRARDKAEFDQFMAERQRGPITPQEPA